MVRYVVTQTAHVSWQLIKRGRTVIPHGITEGRRQDLLTAEERQKTKRDGALARNMCSHLNGTGKRTEI